MLAVKRRSTCPWPAHPAAHCRSRPIQVGETNVAIVRIGPPRATKVAQAVGVVRRRTILGESTPTLTSGASGRRFLLREIDRDVDFWSHRLAGVRTLRIALMTRVDCLFPTERETMTALESSPATGSLLAAIFSEETFLPAEPNSIEETGLLRR